MKATHMSSCMTCLCFDLVSQSHADSNKRCEPASHGCPRWGGAHTLSSSCPPVCSLPVGGAQTTIVRHLMHNTAFWSVSEHCVARRRLLLRSWEGWKCDMHPNCWVGSVASSFFRFLCVPGFSSSTHYTFRSLHGMQTTLWCSALSERGWCRRDYGV